MRISAQDTIYLVYWKKCTEMKIYFAQCISVHILKFHDNEMRVRKFTVTSNSSVLVFTTFQLLDLIFKGKCIAPFCVKLSFCHSYATLASLFKQIWQLSKEYFDCIQLRKIELLRTFDDSQFRGPNFPRRSDSDCRLSEKSHLAPPPLQKSWIRIYEP